MEYVRSLRYGNASCETKYCYYDLGNDTVAPWRVRPPWSRRGKDRLKETYDQKYEKDEVGATAE